MALREVSPGLRTIHNGSNGIAKVSLGVPAGDELTVSEEVAAQLQAQSGAFKDGPATAAAPVAPSPVADESTADAAPAKKAPAKK